MLLRNVVFPNKLTTTFDPAEFEVIERKGNDVTVQGNGKIIRRNISHLKRIPTAPELDTIPISGHSTEPSSAASEGVASDILKSLKFDVRVHENS